MDRLSVRRAWFPRSRRHACPKSGQLAAPAEAPTPKFPNFPGEGQTQHRPLHGGRALAARHVRPQARSLLKYQGQRPSSVEPAHRTHDRRPAALTVRIQAVRARRRPCQQLLPNIASTIDDICVIKSMYTFNPTHTPARSLFHTGNIAATRPSMGAWISYGLGSENKDLPGFVVLGPGPKPAAGWRARVSCRPQHQGTSFDDSATGRRR